MSNRRVNKIKNALALEKRKRSIETKVLLIKLDSAIEALNRKAALQIRLEKVPEYVGRYGDRIALQVDVQAEMFKHDCLRLHSQPVNVSAYVRQVAMHTAQKIEHALVDYITGARA